MSLDEETVVTVMSLGWGLRVTSGLFRKESPVTVRACDSLGLPGSTFLRVSRG